MSLIIRSGTVDNANQSFTADFSVRMGLFI